MNQRTGSLDQVCGLLCNVSSLCNSSIGYGEKKITQIRSSFWKNRQEGIIRSMASLNEPVPETSPGIMDRVNQGHSEWLNAASSSIAS